MRESLFLLLWVSPFILALPQHVEEDSIPDESNLVEGHHTMHLSPPMSFSNEMQADSENIDGDDAANEDDDDDDTMTNIKPVTPMSTQTSTTRDLQHQSEHSMLQAFLAANVERVPGVDPTLTFVHRTSVNGEIPSSSDARSMLFGGNERRRLVPLQVGDLLRDQCHKRPFDQVVSHPGCQNTTIRNYLCYGLCSSLFVPMDNDFIQSCSSCLPTETRSIAVELTCPGREHKLRKHVKIIHTCSCLSCSSRGVYS